ncbi:MAG TPA: hypothetical protein VGW38_19140 [Chloroflexota bacterium]|nr:hypothetical protein [Chloroflexota bacterium]
MTSATVDGFTDCRDLPDEAAQGLAHVERVAAKKYELDGHASRWHRWLRRTGPTNMAIAFDLTEPSRSLVAAFAPYSIHAELRNHQGTVQLVLHDSGGEVSLSADQDVDVSQVAKILDEAQAEYRRSS